MSYESLLVLIPSHSLEDFPTDVGEDEAASALNAFADVWHPALLASAGVLPTWHRADTPPEDPGKRLMIVPKSAESWLPGGWADHARGRGATVVEGLTDRQEMIAAALAGLDTPVEVDADLVADFLALGTCYLQLELLTRQMHYFSNINEMQLQRESVAAAEAALAGDATAARARLQTCFEALLEARERFYPVDCYLLDLCLLIPRLADEHLEASIAAGQPFSLLLSAEDLEAIAAEKPELISKLRDAWNRDELDVIGGEHHEGPATLLPMSSVIAEFTRGHDIFQKRLGRTPKTWGRRRFGFSPQVPQVLAKFDYHSALHLALDDGLYPDAEQSKIRWEGCDGSIVDAITRIPLAADAATSYLRFPTRMSEAMQQDQTAAIVFARWPEVKSPWFDDFRRMQNFAPVLGKLVTLDLFFQQTDGPGRLSKYEAHEYLTPYLIQAVARQEKDPISRFAAHALRRQRFDAADWCRAMTAVLTGRVVPATDGDGPAIDPSAACEQAIEAAGPDFFESPDAPAETLTRAEGRLIEFSADAARQLAGIIGTGAAANRGVLVINPLSFTRRVVVEVPDVESPPEVAGAVKAVQSDGLHRTVVLEVPGSGFVWLPSQPPEVPQAKPGAPMAEGLMLRNDFFEVYLNEATGGIAQIKEYGRKPNRLSQQLAYRFPRERAVAASPDSDEVVKTYYSEMRCTSVEVTHNGPALGEIVTTGDIVDQATNTRLSGFRQVVRVWRARPVVEIETELDVAKTPDGDPWTNYYAARFAWNDSTATLSRSVQQGAHVVRGERIESLDYLEIASDDERTTIIPHGLPFHRKTGPRMLDSLLIVAGETQRRFRFDIAIDQSYPLEASLNSTSQPLVVSNVNGPPRSGNTGWLLHLDARNVQILKVIPASTSGSAGPRFIVRLLETEGRGRSVRLRAFRTPTSARQLDFKGQTLHDLRVESDAVRVELNAHEIADIELRFGE